MLNLGACQTWSLLMRTNLQKHLWCIHRLTMLIWCIMYQAYPLFALLSFFEGPGNRHAIDVLQLCWHLGDRSPREKILGCPDRCPTTPTHPDCPMPPATAHHAQVLARRCGLYRETLEKVSIPQCSSLGGAVWTGSMKWSNMACSHDSISDVICSCNHCCHFHPDIKIDGQFHGVNHHRSMKTLRSTKAKFEDHKALYIYGHES